MKVLFHGYFGMGNVGDEAILSVLINEYGSLGFEPIILSVNPKRSMRLHGIYAIRERLLSPNFWRTLLQSSMLVFAGGGKYGGPTFMRMALLTILAKILGKRVEYRAVGLYPYEWSGSTTLYPEGSPDSSVRLTLKLALRLADKVTVRDVYSKKFVEGFILGKLATLELDPSLRLEPDVRGAENILRSLGLEKEDPIIGLNIRFLRGKVFTKALHAIIKALSIYLEANRDIRLLYIPFGYGSFPGRFFDNDIRIGHLIRKYLHDAGNRFYIIEEELKPQTILGIFKLIKAVICTRHHALVFAHITRTPVLGIAYDTKTIEYLLLMEKLGRSINGRIIKLEDVSLESILSFLENIPM